MKIRASGPENELESLVSMLRMSYRVANVSKLYVDNEDSRYKRVFIDIPSFDGITTIGEYEVIDYCNQWRSKADVMHSFYISYDAAEEILDRLTDSGALIRRIADKRYEYIDARFLQFVGKFCGKCEHRSGFGECLRGVSFDDLKEDYIPVKHPSCDKFEPEYIAIWEVATEENYRKIKEGENE